MRHPRMPGFMRGIAAAALALALVCGGMVALPTQSQGLSPAPSEPASQPAPLRPLSVSPDRGVVGSVFAVTADGLTPGVTVDWQWQTWDGWYETTPSAETVAYERRSHRERRFTVGTSVVDAQGTASVTFQAPEDFGEVHDIYAVVNGVDMARGGFRIQFSAEIYPTSGPVGTPITIHVKGMAARLFSGTTLAVRWDNSYTGLLTATTTRGTANGQLRAAGPVGEHFVVLNAGTVPAYLNIHQSPYDFVYSHLENQEELRLPFTVTSDDGSPAEYADWPDPARVAPLDARLIRTAAGAEVLPGVTASLAPAAGPILSRPMLHASGLTPNEPVQMWWVTARGNRVTPSGWSLQDIPLPSAVADGNGEITVPIEVPDDLGGWHVAKLAQNGRVVAEAPYYVERSLVSVSARQVRVGDTVEIHLKGIGWTELDNGFAVTYDNSHIGYACGFNSNGDVLLKILASGTPGTHLIDLYPMVYAGKDSKDWYWAPVLTFAEDFPALGLGYRLPAFRIAIEIVP